MKRAISSLCLIALVALAGGCGTASSTDSDTSTGSDGSNSSSGDKKNTAATLVKSGFGQADEYVWVTALVHNDSDVVGQTVTVHFDLMDKNGKLVKSGDQVDAFTQVGEDLAVGTQLDVPRRIKIGSVKATLQVEDAGAFSEEPGPVLRSAPATVRKGEFGDWGAHFELTNTTNKPVKNPHIGVICYDAKGTINGGTVEFPELVPAKGTVAVDTNSLLVSGRPAKCEVYPSGPLM